MPIYIYIYTSNRSAKFRNNRSGFTNISVFSFKLDKSRRKPDPGHSLSREIEVDRAFLASGKRNPLGKNSKCQQNANWSD